MSDRPDRDPRGIVGTEYLVDVETRLPDAGGGIDAFAASRRDRDIEPLMALRVDRFTPARPRHLVALTGGIDGLLTPLGHGVGPPIDGEPAWYVICRAPSGPPVSAGLRPWPEHTLIELVLRPIALMLEQLQSRGLTHRGIRPNNVFHGQPGRPVTLGAAWAAPPAMHQTALHETAYTALCHPAARGDGRTADDVYALGVLLVTLALGRSPMGGIDDSAIMYRKLELGDFVAITGGERLPPILTDLVRGMLAEDPEHRPPAALLRDPVGARGRRVAARPASRAQTSFKIGATMVWNTKTLALAMALDPTSALETIQGGTLMYWLRRALGDSGLAVKLEELVRQGTLDVTTAKETANAVLVMRAITDTDVFMPLCWRGLAVFPDGLGPALATVPTTAGTIPGDQRADPDLRRKLLEIVLNEAQAIWAAMREDRAPAAPHRQESRQRRALLQIRGPGGGAARLIYMLNPMIPCASALLAGRWIVNVSELVPALNAVATATPDGELLEPHIAAFIGARSERWLDDEVKALAHEGDDMERAIIVLRLLTELQTRYYSGPLKGLASWMATRAQPLIDRWNNRERRASVEDQLKTVAAAGFLQPMLALLADPTGQAADSEGLRVAIADLENLDAELLGFDEGGAQRSAVAARLGQEIAAGIGLAAIATTMILAALG